MSLRRSSSRAGLTLIELLIGSVLSVAVVVEAAFVVDATLALADGETAGKHSGDQARSVIERITLALMGSAHGARRPEIGELHSQSIRYSSFLGLEGGEVVWGAPEQICLEDRSTLAWRARPGAVDERKEIWSERVSPLLEGELLNGLDDNRNGLIDEDGLSFARQGNRVVIRLTLRPEVGGAMVRETAESVVACRN